MEPAKTLHCPWCGVVIPREEILEKRKCARCGWVFNLKWDCESDSMRWPVGDSEEQTPRVDSKTGCGGYQFVPVSPEDFQHKMEDLCAEYDRYCKGMVGLELDNSTIQVKSSLLAEASELIHGDRAKDYGDAKESFAHIAALWSAYTKTTISPQDVAMMMSLLKMSRAKHSGFTHRDSFVDMAGYVALASDIGE